MAKNGVTKKAVVKTSGVAAEKRTAVGTKTAPAAVKAKPAAVAPKTVAVKSKPAVAALNGTAKKAGAKPKTPVAKPLPKAKPVAAQKEKIKKPKLVRDSFTMPETEYQVLGAVKRACLKAGFDVKKSELLRVGVALLQKLEVSTLKGVLAGLPPLKAGRPKQEK